MLRHAVPEGANAVIDTNRRTDPTLCKLTADVSFPGATLSSLLPELSGMLGSSGIDAALFGHLGGRHFHVNLLPQNKEERLQAEALCEKLCSLALQRGGSMAAENGVGKTKRDLLRRLLPQETLSAMRAVKDFFDPSGILNPGNLF